MPYTEWTVDLAKKVGKAIKRLNKEVRFALFSLLKEMEIEGPYRVNWPNYGKLKRSSRLPMEALHCHIKKGHPTYVACWRVVDKDKHIIEVFYVGTHERSPY